MDNKSFDYDKFIDLISEPSNYKLVKGMCKALKISVITASAIGGFVGFIFGRNCNKKYVIQVRTPKV